jgi:phosphoglycolate phosphatase
MPDYPKVTVGALIENHRGEVLFLVSHKWKGQLGIPSGKVERGEQLLEALQREVGEETGLSITDIRFLLLQEVIDHPDFYVPAHFVSLNYRCRVSGGALRLNEEAQHAIWCSLDAALELDLNEPTRELVQAALERGT